MNRYNGNDWGKDDYLNRDRHGGEYTLSHHSFHMSVGTLYSRRQPFEAI